MAKTRSRRRSSGRLRLLRNILIGFLVLVVAAPPLWVAIYRLVPPPITLLMIERVLQGHGLERRWAPIGEISPDMIRAVIASEDSRFCSHHGFDLTAIDKALQHNEARPGRVRGGSTISQQTAKNVFLWPDRSWVRQGVEAWFSVLFETMWGKRRIMEVYLNTVETGPGLYGVEAASRRYFHASARDPDSRGSGQASGCAAQPAQVARGRAGPRRPASDGAHRRAQHDGRARRTRGLRPWLSAGPRRLPSRPRCD